MANAGYPRTRRRRPQNGFRTRISRACFSAQGRKCSAASGNLPGCCTRPSKSSIPAVDHSLTLTRDRRIDRRDLARGRVGAERGLQLSDRGLEARDLRPLLALAIARLRGRRVVLIQHEWGGLHWLRRITYMPALLLADTDRDVLAAGAARTRRAIRWSAGPRENACWRRCRRTSRRRPGLPIPNCASGSPPRAQSGRLVIGHFGSIYPGKQPNALLDIGAILKARGLQAADRLYRLLHPRRRQGRGGVSTPAPPNSASTDDVIVSGYVASDHEVFGLFSEIDAFCYPLDEGLTARRSSVLDLRAVRPARRSSPARREADEFDHHPRFKELIDRGAIVLVPRGAERDAYADRIVVGARNGRRCRRRSISTDGGADVAQGGAARSSEASLA